jgi:hypothetical protein
MLSIEDLQRLRFARQADGTRREDVMRALGVTPAEVVSAATALMQSPDRNTRVAMLRVLAHESGEMAGQAVLAGLHDRARRARDVAARSCGHYLGIPAIVERLRTMAEDEGENRKIRWAALQALAGLVGEAPSRVPAIAADVLETMARTDRLRAEVLFRLLQVELTPEVERLLRDFVKTGTREEAVMATRALCGFQVVNLGQFSEPEKSRVVQTCEVAAGRVWYWVKRAGR